MLRTMTIALCVASTTARASTTSTRSHAARSPISHVARRCAQPSSRSSSVHNGYAECRAAKSSSSSSSSSSYEVFPVVGDGRCLFRSVAVARSLSERGERLGEKEELAHADALREAAVNELLERRDETEWFIEGDFDDYCARMRRPSSWGGEPEILMLTHVLASPISVYMESDGLRRIARYGEELYLNEPQFANLAVLFHGGGHYEALLVNEED